MKIKTKFLGWSAGIPVVLMHKELADKLGVRPQGRVSLRTCSKKSKELSSIVDVVENHIVKKNEIAITNEVKKEMGLRKGQCLDINLIEAPHSLYLIRKKLDKKKLNQQEIHEIIKDIVSNNLSQAEIALFVSAMYQNGMNTKETTYLIKAILKNGNLLKVRNKLVVDKHCIGGIPGNRTTPLVVAICAAAGLTFPKTSSKAITSAAGTADTIEVLSPIEFSVPKLKQVLKKTNAFLVWGGALGMVPADSKIIQVEKDLKIDPEAQLLASIMSKKLAVGSNYILIDIPYGKTAKVQKKRAERLKRKFENLGKIFHKEMKVLLTKANEPIGNGIGPALEMIDILKVLKQESERPKDLEKKSVFLAGQILEMTKKSKKGSGEKLAREILESGKAFKKFEQIIKAQGGKIKSLKLAKHSKVVVAKRTGTISEIDNKLTNSLARVAGCPADKFSGLYLHHHVGERVKKGEKLITIYAESESRLSAATRFYRRTSPIKLK